MGEKGFIFPGRRSRLKVSSISRLQLHLPSPAFSAAKLKKPLTLAKLRGADLFVLSHLVEFCKQLWWSTTCKTRYEMELDASRRVRRGCYLESQVLRGRPVSPLRDFAIFTFSHPLYNAK